MQMVPVRKPAMSLRTIFQKIMPQKVINTSANSSQFLIAPNPTPIASPNFIQVAAQPKQVMVQRPPSIQPQQLVMMNSPPPTQQIFMQHQPVPQPQKVVMNVQPSHQIGFHVPQYPTRSGVNYVHLQNPNPIGTNSGRSVILQANNINPIPFQNISYKKY